MRISVAWLRALLPALAMDSAAIAERITRAGLEVEAIHHFGAGLEPVVVAAVVSARPHPSRSGLQLVSVDRGGGVIQEVVCGAPNVPPPGGLVVLAPVGTHLPAAAGGKGLTLTSRAIGGVVSDGMLCSESELGVGWGAGDAGILVLPAGIAEPGTPIARAIPSIVDDVLDIAVPPNRPDALGHIGVARELAAILDLPFGVPEPAAPNRVLSTKVEAMARVHVDEGARERCPHYGALVVVDVTVGPSPLWMRYRLHALGVRSLSNVVDATNLVMMEFGHPLHAFDLDLVAGSAIQVRLAREGERMQTLDGVTRTLTSDDLVICDGAPDGGSPVALAGVMGGGNSEISAATRRVLLECAYFEPRGIRRTARRHGLHTESSHRFERGVDPGAVTDAIAQAAGMIVRLGNGAAVTGMLNAMSGSYDPRKIRLRHARIEALLGGPVDRDQASRILDRLGCEVGPWVEGEGGAVGDVVVPTHRPDVQREVDLIEEVARIRGYDEIPTTLPAILPQSGGGASSIEQRARHAARALGLAEAINLAFCSPRDLEMLGAPTPTVHLQNPLGEERSVMRTSLLPGLLADLARSRRRGERRIRLFEVAARFLEGGPERAQGLCDEVPSFAAVVAGPRDSWLGKGDEVDVYDVAGHASELVYRLTGREARTRSLEANAAPPHLHPRGAAEVSVDGTPVGTLGPLHPDVVDRFELDGGAIVLEIDLRAVDRLGVVVPQFRPLPTLPAVTRDVALEVDEAVEAGDIAARLHENAGETCEAVEVFDVYRGKGIADGKKSIAFRIRYRDPAMARTLTDAEVDTHHARAIEATRSLGAVQRA